MKIASKVKGIKVNSTRPRFTYYFANDNPIEMPESHAEKLLRNSTFYISDKQVEKPKKALQKAPIKEKPWLQELEDIKGIGKKTALDIIQVYPLRGSLLEAIASKAHLPFPENAVKLLKKEFIH